MCTLPKVGVVVPAPPLPRFLCACIVLGKIVLLCFCCVYAWVLRTYVIWLLFVLAPHDHKGPGRGYRSTSCTLVCWTTVVYVR